MCFSADISGKPKMVKLILSIKKSPLFLGVVEDQSKAKKQIEYSPEAEVNMNANIQSYATDHLLLRCHRFSVLTVRTRIGQYRVH